MEPLYHGISLPPLPSIKRNPYGRVGVRGHTYTPPQHLVQRRRIRRKLARANQQHMRRLAR